MLSIYIDEKWPDSKGMTNLQWSLLKNGSHAPITGVANDASELPKARNIEVIVPASVASITSVDTPKQNRKLMLKALRFAVEEQVIDDPEILHVAPANDYLADGKLPVAIINRKWFATALNLLAEKEIFPEAVRIEALLLPLEKNGITLVWNGKEGFMRTGKFSGGAIDAGDSKTPPMALKMAIAEARNRDDAPEKIKIYLTDTASSPNTALWALDLGTRVEVKKESWNFGSGTIDIKQRGINLLQGDIVPSHQIQKMAQQGKLTASLVLVICLAYVGFVFTDWFALKMETNRLQTEIHDTFKTAFPKARAIVDPPLQMRRNLAELRWRAGGTDDNDLIPMLATVTSAISTIAKIERFEYNKGILKLDIVTSGDRQFFSARESLTAKGLVVKPGPGKRYDYGYKTRITVTRKDIK